MEGLFNPKIASCVYYFVMKDELFLIECELIYVKYALYGGPCRGLITNEWKYNHQLDEEYEKENTVRHIKAYRSRWVGHVLISEYHCFIRKVFWERLKDRRRENWKDAVIDDLKWTMKNRNPKQWRHLIKATITFAISCEAIPKRRRFYKIQIKVIDFFMAIFFK